MFRMGSSAFVLTLTQLDGVERRHFAPEGGLMKIIEEPVVRDQKYEEPVVPTWHQITDGPLAGLGRRLLLEMLGEDSQRPFAFFVMSGAYACSRDRPVGLAIVPDAVCKTVDPKLGSCAKPCARLATLNPGTHWTKRSCVEHCRYWKFDFDYETCIDKAQSYDDARTCRSAAIYRTKKRN